MSFKITELMSHENAPAPTFKITELVSHEPVKIKRIAPGAYEVHGTKGTYLIDEHTEGWYLTYPGRLRADDVYGTLRSAKAAAIYFDTH